MKYNYLNNGQINFIKLFWPGLFIADPDLESNLSHKYQHGPEVYAKYLYIILSPFLTVIAPLNK